MKILLLEDDPVKRADIKSSLSGMGVEMEIVEVGNWFDYSNRINTEVFDLILLDIMVPRSPRDPRVEDHCSILAETTRSNESRAFRTPAIVLTRFLEQSEEFFRELNRVDITVISFDNEGEWKSALQTKVLLAQPKARFDFIVVCALAKEAAAYEGIVDRFGELKTLSGLLCREIVVGGKKGAIVLPPRMGLISSGLVTAFAIERFDPKLVCMSGICGGIPTESKVYDVLVTEICHQHDVGKWIEEGLKGEHYDIQINPILRDRLEALINDNAVHKFVGKGIDFQRFEYPEGMDSLELNMRLAATSSGSAVIAEAGKTATLSGAQRKLAGFDMEIYAVYEAARLSKKNPLFFAVKTVVDDGDKNKGDRFHRVGSLLSARFTVSAIRSGILDSNN